MATVRVSGIPEEFTTDLTGKLNLPVMPGNITFRAEHERYEEESKTLDIKKDTIIRLLLKPVKRKKDRAEIEAIGYATSEWIANPKPGIVTVQSSKLDSLPMVFNEKDLLKSLHIKAGIRSTSNQMASISISGLSSSQNQYFFNGIPLQNPLLLSGFCSVFNGFYTDSITAHRFSKPIEYGGKVGSVISGSTKRPLLSETLVQAELTPLSVRTNVNTPLISGKLGLRIFTDYAYASLWTNLGDPAFIPDNFAMYHIGAEALLVIDETQQVSITTLIASDRRKDKMLPFFPEEGLASKHGINGTSVRWRINRENVTNRVTAGFSGDNYKYSDTYSTEPYKSNVLTEGVTNIFINEKLDFKKSERIKYTTGVSFNLQNHKAAIRTVNIDEISADSEFLPAFSMIEAAFFAETDYEINDQLILQIGAWGAFNKVGKNTNTSLEPRLAMRYLPNSFWSVKLSYMQLTQALHTVSESRFDIYKPYTMPWTDTHKPESSRNLAFSVVLDNGVVADHIRFSVSAFINNSLHVAKFNPGYGTYSFTNTGFMWNEIDKNLVFNGSSLNYGFDFDISYTTNKYRFMWYYSYLSASELFIRLNNNQLSVSDTDRPHALGFNFGYSPDGKAWLSVQWQLVSGSPYSIPSSYAILPTGWQNTPEYVAKTQAYWLYTNYNAYHMSAYQSLDVQWLRKFVTRQGFAHTLTVALTNMYNHPNAQAYVPVLESNNDVYDYKLYKITLFPILPSLSYRFGW